MNASVVEMASPDKKPIRVSEIKVTTGSGSILNSPAFQVAIPRASSQRVTEQESEDDEGFYKSDKIEKALQPTEE